MPTNAVAVFAALGDPTRLKLVSRLSSGEECSIADLARGLRLTRQGTAKHLRILERAGIVTSRSIGRKSLFHYAPKTLRNARSYLDTVSVRWDEALSRLALSVES